MKTFYAVRNLRSINEMNLIELKPITILLGTNNSGKSSFLRSFPLIRQSLENRIAAPILWIGDYVDFNDYSTAVRNFKQDRDITFEFGLQEFNARNAECQGFSPQENLSNDDKNFDSAELTITIGSHQDRTTLKNLQLKLADCEICTDIHFLHDSNNISLFNINNDRIDDFFSNLEFVYEFGSLFPRIGISQRDAKESLENGVYSNFTNAMISELQKVIESAPIAENLKPIAIGESGSILTYSRFNESTIKNLLANATDKSLQKFYRDLAKDLNSTLVADIDRVCLANWTIFSLNAVTGILKEFMLASSYLSPNRSIDYRAYKYRELDVSEISPNAINLPMYLATLTKEEFKELASWMRELLGYEIAIEKNSGSFSIKMQRKDLQVNIAEAGYGVSQVLPVFAKIWDVARKKEQPNGRQHISCHNGNGEKFRPITIEEPELNLHPTHQAKIADLLVKAVKENIQTASPFFIVETHSQAIVNRLGELIEYGKISRKDVQIIVFSDELENDNSTSVTTSHYNENGVLENWPIGFFQY